ncbi:MAG: T9SS type A sorting domain-containing protein [candidate division Zixibacteria bacterium]|nr:T9SS type A sorting domain-containing protein [candidate division Zixibacteria bacterium]
MFLRLRKSLILVYLILWAIGAYATGTAAERIVLGEFITNTGCMACYIPEVKLDTLGFQYSERFAIIRYHASYPQGSDPFYLFNPVQNDLRYDYYNDYPFLPRFYLDGNYIGNVSAYRDSILNHMATPAPIRMELSGSLNRESNKGFINVVANIEDQLPIHPVNMRIALTESHIYYPAPNGTDIHHQVFRGMLPSVPGEARRLIGTGPHYFYYEFDLNGAYIETDNCELIAFIQDDTTWQVIQAAKEDLSEFYDVSRVEIEMTGYSHPIIIPSGGGQVIFDGSLDHNAARYDTFKVWTMIEFPNGTRYGPLEEIDIPLGPMEEIDEPELILDVPETAPAGAHKFIAFVGYDYQNVLDSTILAFIKTGKVADIPPGGVNAPTHIENYPSLTTGLGSFPNPFNPETNLTIVLDSSQPVILEIYNIRGQLVESLVNGYLEEGIHTLRWDGSQEPSGIYFARLKTGSENHIQKLILLK